jgi:uncharacterized membrane protein YhaH (DUF805 family)
MNIVDLLFGFGGRVNRAKYWLTLAIWLALWVLVLAFVLVSEFSTPSLILAALVFVPSCWSGIAVGVKRLHDREQSGWWLLLFYLAPAILDAAARNAGALGTVFSFASLAITIWAIVVLGFLRGTIGPNAYGPDPVAPKLGEH